MQIEWIVMTRVPIAGFTPSKFAIKRLLFDMINLSAVFPTISFKEIEKSENWHTTHHWQC